MSLHVKLSTLIHNITRSIVIKRTEYHTLKTLVNNEPDWTAD